MHPIDQITVFMKAATFAIGAFYVLRFFAWLGSCVADAMYYTP